MPNGPNRLAERPVLKRKTAQGGRSQSPPHTATRPNKLPQRGWAAGLMEPRPAPAPYSAASS